MGSQGSKSKHDQPEEEDYNTVNERIMREMVKDSFDDKAYGCIFGAFIGDACGSRNEFTNHIETEEVMDEYMKMPGGGPHEVGPGQITDDSELAICLMVGIIQGNEV